MGKEDVYDKWISDKASKELKYSVLEAMQEYANLTNAANIEKIRELEAKLSECKILIEQMANPGRSRFSNIKEANEFLTKLNSKPITKEDFNDIANGRD